MNTVTANTVIDAMTQSRRAAAWLFSAALITAPMTVGKARAAEAAGVGQPTQDAVESAAESFVETAPPPRRPKPFPHPAALGAPLLQRPGAVPPAAAVPPPPFLIKLGVAGEVKATDNVRAAPGASKKSDLITSITPSLGLSYKTGKLDFNLSYELAYDRYAASQELDGFRHNGLGVLDAELIKRILFVDSRFSVSEQNVNPTGPTAADERTTSANRTRATTFSVTPRLQQRLGRWAVGQASYRHSETRYDKPSDAAAVLIGGAPGDLGDNSADTFRLELRNGEEFSRLFWDYGFETSRQQQNHQSLNQKTHDLGAEYRVSKQIGVLAQVGHDDIRGGGVDSAALSGVFYSGGLRWTPSPDVDLRVGWGERNGADNLYVLGEYKFSPMTVLRVSHKTNIATDSMAAVEALDAVRRDPTGAYIDPFSGAAANPGASPFTRSNAIYRQRVSSAILSHTSARETISVAVSMAKQTVVGGFDLGQAAIQSAARGTANTTVSLGLGWTHLLTPTTSITFTGSRDAVVESNAPTGKSERYRAGLSLSHQMNPLLSADVSYRFADWKPEVGPRIRENMIIFGLRKRL